MPEKKSFVIIITDSYVRAFIAQSSVASSLGAVQCAVGLAWDGSHVGDLHYPVTSLFLLVFGAVHCAVELAWDGSMSGTFITQSPITSSLGMCIVPLIWLGIMYHRKVYCYYDYGFPH